MEKFLLKYSPSLVEKENQSLMRQYQKVLPESLLSFWENHGLGKYGEGLIELINPETYRETLNTWLGKEMLNYVPIAMSAFGELFYYRKLTEKDEDVCILDPHYRKIEVCTWSLDQFFDEYLCDEDIIKDLLRENLFNEALSTVGKLDQDEIYIFTPALALGGSENINSLRKGNSIVCLDILFQLG